MAKIPLKCPSDDTLPAILKCAGASAERVQAVLTAAIFKKVECECDCDPFVIVTVTATDGECPDEDHTQYSVVVRMGCIDLADEEEREYFFKGMKTEEGFKALAAMIADYKFSTTQKQC